MTRPWMRRAVRTLVSACQHSHLILPLLNSGFEIGDYHKKIVSIAGAKGDLAQGIWSGLVNDADRIIDRHGDGGHRQRMGRPFPDATVEGWHQLHARRVSGPHNL